MRAGNRGSLGGVRRAMSRSTVAALVTALVALTPLAVDASARDADAAARAVNGLGSQIHLALSEQDPQGNLVFSPFSIETALAMASGGARGETLAQMNDALGLSMDDPHGAIAALTGAVLDSGEGSLSVANSLWAQDALPIEPDFTSLLENAYGSELELADFVGDPEGAREGINAWVAANTDERIPTLLAPGAVDELTRLVLVNAVLLRADWLMPFDRESTSDDAFTTGSGDEVTVPTMHRTLPFADYAESGGIQAVVLPYTNGFEMVVVLPAEGGLAELEQQLAADLGALDTLLAGAASTEVVLSLPRWDIETSTALAAQLQALGMTDAFTDAADFSGITTAESLHIDDVVHQANITVTEAGTEAAAATAVMIAASAPVVEPEPAVMDVDRPFIFAVRDAATGTILFQGRVTDPS